MLPAVIQMREVPGREDVDRPGGHREGVGDPGGDEICAGDGRAHQVADDHDVGVLIGRLQATRHPQLGRACAPGAQLEGQA